MEMAGERLIAADRHQVWEKLNDTDTLRACIPGCESIDRLSPTEMKAVAKVKIGPMSARFTGAVTLSDLDPPNGYTISGSGQGGAAGFAKGGASVALVEQADGTLLTYSVKAQVGGKMAQIGARLIDATAKSLADQFFTRFAEHLGTPDAEVVAPEKEGFVKRRTAAIKGLFAGRKDEPV